MILADENIAAPIVARLAEEGYDVVQIGDIAPSITDTEILRRAVSKGALVLTDDKDFGELVVRRRKSHHGVVLLRLAGVPNHRRAEMVSALFNGHGAELWRAFTVLDANGRVRMRHP